MKRCGMLGIPMPRLLAADIPQERILKEYIAGPTAAELLKAGRPEPGWLAQVPSPMCRLLYPAGLNIDYYPTNFVPLRLGVLYCTRTTSAIKHSEAQRDEVGGIVVDISVRPGTAGGTWGSAPAQASRAPAVPL